MQDLHCSFKNTRARDLLSHAISQFPIYPFTISENKARLKKSWDASAPFTDLFKCTLEVQECATNKGRPIDDRKTTTEVYTVIYQMGILTEDCEKWNERPNVDSIWKNFQSQFIDAQQRCGGGRIRPPIRQDSTGLTRC